MFRRSPSLKILSFAIIGFIFGKLVTFSLFGLISFSLFFLIAMLTISLIIRSKMPLFIYFAFLFGFFTSIRTQHLDYLNKSNCNTLHNGYFYGNVSKVITLKPKLSRVIIDGKILNDEWHLIRSTRFLLTIINSKYRQINNVDNKDLISGAIEFRKPNKANLPNEFNELNYLRNMECEFTASGFSNKIALININRPDNAREQTKKSLFNRIDQLYSKSTSGIVKAILLGDKSEINRNTRQEFAVTGVAHILAVSGFHVGIIAGILFWLFSFFRNEKVKFILISISLSGYIYLVDFQPSAVRAGIMIILFLFTLLMQRKANPINIIATTILLVSAFNPSSLYSVGFQMSIAAISGIFLLYTPFREFFHSFFKMDKTEFTKKIANSLAVSLAASAVVSPIVAYYFGIYSIISPLANLVVIPFMLFGQVFGIVALVSSYIFLPLGHLFANTSQLSIEIATIITHYAAELPFSHLAGENVISVALITSAILVYLFLSNSPRRLLFRLVVVVFFTSIFIIKLYTQSEPNTIVYERANSYLIYNKVKNVQILISKKNCKPNWDDFGLLNYLKTRKPKLLLYNIPDRMRYSLYKNKVRYKKINEFKAIKPIIN